MKALQSLAAFLSRETPAFVTAAAVVAYFFPVAFRWVHGDFQTAILGVIMLAMGMTLTAADFKVIVSRPWEIAIGTVAQFAIMPLLAFGLVHFLHLPKGIAVGLILVGCCPGGVSSNIMSFLCKGDVAFSVGMTALSTLLAPIMTPFLMLHLAGELIEIDAAGMFKSVLLVTLFPVLLGFALNSILGKTAGYRDAVKLMPGAAVIGLACIVGGVTAAHGADFIKSGIWIFVAVFMHNSLGYVLGYACGVAARFARPKKRTISIEVGMQNAGLATVLAGKHFQALPEAAIASAVSCVWHSISGALMAGVFNFCDRLSEKFSKRMSGGAEIVQ
ncbi:MAG: bile acid:sodium symporter family protein [Kiritimatiellae bacterium]|nr:bile acid:sodium symporter family protein [Kiritimatiellia bacterium]